MVEAAQGRESAGVRRGSDDGCIRGGVRLSATMASAPTLSVAARAAAEGAAAVRGAIRAPRRGSGVEGRSTVLLGRP